MPTVGKLLININLLDKKKSIIDTQKTNKIGNNSIKKRFVPIVKIITVGTYNNKYIKTDKKFEAITLLSKNKRGELDKNNKIKSTKFDLW
jgi:hypothetical protein